MTLHELLVVVAVVVVPAVISHCRVGGGGRLSDLPADVSEDDPCGLLHVRARYRRREYRPGVDYIHLAILGDTLHELQHGFLRPFVREADIHHRHGRLWDLIPGKIIAVLFLHSPPSTSTPTSCTILHFTLFVTSTEISDREGSPPSSGLVVEDLLRVASPFDWLAAFPQLLQIIQKEVKGIDSLPRLSCMSAYT